MNKKKLKELKLISLDVRKNIIDMVYNAKSGHIAGAVGLADIFTYLYKEFLDINKIKKNSNERDFVLLSNGHVVAVLYSILYEIGILKKKDLKIFRKFGSKLQGHPHYGTIIGVENTAGPLGQGLSQAVGLASVLKRENKKNRVFCFVGDGELEEGEIWEAFLFASKEKLNNLTIIIDYNHIQIDGDPEKEGSLDKLHQKLSSFGLIVIEFNGNNFNQIETAFNNLKVCSLKEKPIVFLAKNTPGCCIDFMENNKEWHGKAPNKEEYKKAIDILKKLKEEIENE